jgi:hypothetical protein
VPEFLQLLEAVPDELPSPVHLLTYPNGFNLCAADK